MFWHGTGFAGLGAGVSNSGKVDLFHFLVQIFWDLFKINIHCIHMEGGGYFKLCFSSIFNVFWGFLIVGVRSYKHGVFKQFSFQYSLINMGVLNSSLFNIQRYGQGGI